MVPRSSLLPCVRASPVPTHRQERARRNVRWLTCEVEQRTTTARPTYGTWSWRLEGELFEEVAAEIAIPMTG